jgi:hypothetical protein
MFRFERANLRVRPFKYVWELHPPLLSGASLKAGGKCC